MTRTVSEVLPDLAHFTGTTAYVRYRQGGRTLLLTDGAKYVAEKAGAYWLMDIIALNCRDWLLEGNGFCVVELRVTGYEGRLRVEDGNGGLIHDQLIEFTDFPEPGLAFFLQPYMDEPVLMLKSEY